MPSPTYTSPNMNIVLPTVGVDTGPDYAQRVDTALGTTVDNHNHTPGNGVLVPTAGIGINADLNFNTNGAKQITYVQFDPFRGAPTSNINSLSDYSGDLYFTNGSGDFIRLTQNGGVGPVGPGTLNIVKSAGVGSTPVTASTNTFVDVTGTSVQITTGLQGVIELTLQADLSGSSGFVTTNAAGAAQGEIQIIETEQSIGVVNITTIEIAGGTGTAVYQIPPSALNCKLTGLPANTQYTFHVQINYTAATGAANKTSAFGMLVVAQSY